MKHVKAQGLLFYLLLLLFSYSAAVAQQEVIPLNPKVRTGKLPNGMTYYIQKNTKPENRVELRLAINAGSVLEDEDQLGMAHLVEHMGFNGTKNFEKNELVHYLQSVGVDFGPEINAYTSFDETVYMLTIPSDSAEILNKGFRIMVDWAHNMTLDHTEIDKERGVVLEEWRLRQGASQRMSAQYLPVLFAGSKYADRLPIGTKESIEGAGYEAIKRFYKEWYRPDLAAFIVVGDIDPDQMEKKIKSEFAEFKAPEKIRERAHFSIPDNKDPLISIVSDQENPFNSVMVMYKADKEKAKNTDDYLRQQSYRMFTGMLNQRFNELLKNSDPPFIRASAYYGSLLRSKSAFQLNAQVGESGIERGLKAILTENERVRKYGFTPQEFERYKKNMLKGLEQAYNERDKTESGRLVWAYVQHFLNNEPAPGIEFEYNFLKDNIHKTELKEINKLASKWIRDENQVVIVLGADKEGVKLPAEADIKRIMKEVSSEEISPYMEEELPENIMAQKPAAGKIVKEEKVEDLDLTILTLSNGAKVMLRPTDFKNDEILMKAHSYGGFSKFPKSYYMSHRMSVNTIQESGLAEFSKYDLQKMLAGKTVNVSPFIGFYEQGLNGMSSTDDLETLLQLIHLNFTAARRDEEAFQSLLARQKATYQNLLTEPVNYFFNEVRAIRFDNDPRMVSIPSAEDWDKANLDQIHEIYQESFKNAGSFNFYFVGSFDPEKIKPLLETYLASLPSTGEKIAYTDMGIRAVKGPLTKKITRGSAPKSFVSVYLESEGEYSKEESHKLWSLSNILKRIYTDKLREEMSGVYGMNTSINVEKNPYPHFFMEITIPCSPDNVDTLVNAAFAEIERIKKNGIPEEELQKEIEAQRRQLETEMKNNGSWLWKLNKIGSYEEDYTRLRNPDELIKLVNSKDLQEVANKYLDLSKAIQVSLYPETGKAMKQTDPPK